MYRQRIQQIAPNHNPAHVEAFMRCEHGTLDALSAAEFIAEALIAAQCAESDPAMAEQLAQSYGLQS